MILPLHIQLVQHFTEQIYKHNLQLYNAKSFQKFRNTLLNLGRPTPDLLYANHHLLDLNLFTILRLGWINSLGKKKVHWEQMR